MKLIHCADIHLGSPMTENFGVDVARKRQEEIWNTFLEMFRYARENGIQAVVIAGDLFDEKQPKSVWIQRVAKVIEMYPEISVFYLKGNHDEYAGFPSELKPKNLYEFDRDGTVYELGNQNAIRLIGAEEVTKQFYENLKLDTSKINLVVLHGQLTEYAGHKRDEIPRIKLQQRGIDYLMLGHIHSYQQTPLDARGICCYSGCLEGRGFDECGAHGFVELDIDEALHKITTKFIPIAYRSLHRITIDISAYSKEPEELTNRILSEVKEKLSDYDEEDLFRIELTGEVGQQTELPVEVWNQAWTESYFYLEFVDKTRKRVSTTREGTLKGTFIQCVQQRQDLSQEEKTEIIRIGIQALQGEEIL